MKNKMSKKTLIPVIIILLVILLGFIIAIFLPEINLCTKMGCPCEDIDGERPCNLCTVSDPIFVLGIINIAKACFAQEVVLCENNQNIDQRIDIDNNSCEYKISFFSYSNFF